MTTTPQTASHEKARAFSTGLEVMSSFDAATRQGLAGNIQLIKLADFDNSITVCKIAPVRADKSTSAWFLTLSQAGGM